MSPGSIIPSLWKGYSRQVLIILHAGLHQLAKRKTRPPYYPARFAISLFLILQRNKQTDKKPSKGANLKAMGTK